MVSVEPGSTAVPLPVVQGAISAGAATFSFPRVGTGYWTDWYGVGAAR